MKINILRIFIEMNLISSYVILVEKYDQSMLNQYCTLLTKLSNMGIEFSII